MNVFFRKILECEDWKEHYYCLTVLRIFCVADLYFNYYIGGSGLHAAQGPPPRTAQVVIITTQYRNICTTRQF